MPGPTLTIRDPRPDWAKEPPSVFESPWRRYVARPLSSVLGLDDPQGQLLGLLGAMETGPAGGLQGKLQEGLTKLSEVVKGIRAYHGSPHDFEQFALEKIGTGEGAQAYGHGLYFAEKEGTARSYRDALTYQRHMGTRQQGEAFFDALAANGTIDGKVPVGRNQRLWSRDELGEALLSGRLTAFDFPPAIQKRVQDAVLQGKGRMYEVNIEAHLDDFLDWDKPLREQSPKVREAVHAAMGDVRPVRLVDGTYGVTVVSPGGQGRVISSAWGKTPEAAMDDFRKYMESAPGGQVYSEIAAARNFQAAGRGQEAGAQATASQALREASIPGIKYLDQASRRAGAGTRNYVVFDDALITILRKYGLLPPVAAGTLGLSQLARPTPEARK